MKKLLFIYFILTALLGFAQNEKTEVRGLVRDSRNKEPLPFVSIGFLGTGIGTTTNFEGKFNLHANAAVDSIRISYVGYKTKTIAIKRNQSQVITIELKESTAELREITIKPGINPAVVLINKARKARKKNDVYESDALEYSSYTKVDLSLNNISDKMKSKKLYKPLAKLFDTTYQMKNEEGKYILPLFVSETFSRMYYNKKLNKNKEEILANTITGVGVESNSFLNDLLGSSLAQFNFNKNYLRILGKDIMSPLADNSHSYYIFTLLDSTIENNRKTYKIKMNLRREQDLGFLGFVWIDDQTFAISRIDAELAPSANINFLDRLKIQQEMKQTADGPYMVVKNRMVVDISELTKNTSGIVARIYNAYSDEKLNQAKAESFFDVPIEHIENDSLINDTSFWNKQRNEGLTSIEKQMFTMVDSIKNLPVIRTYVDVVRIIVEGHKRIGKLDWGPYIFLYGYNHVEGNRLRLGFKTNSLFSRNWVITSYLAYGFKDEKFKYSLGADYIFNRKHWSVASLQYRDDNDILGISNDISSVTGTRSTSNAFQALSIFSKNALINHTQEIKASVFTQASRDWSYKVSFMHHTYQPLGDNFKFEYKQANDTSQSAYSFTSANVGIEIRWAHNEMLNARGNARIRLRRSDRPVLTLAYTRGVSGLFGSQFDYDRVNLNINQHISTGIWGNADYFMNIGQIYGTLPYPLLDVARGNQLFLYSDVNYSLMNLYEFISDQYIHGTYVQHFEGLFVNRIPLLRQTKLRNFAFVKGVYGTLSDKNKMINPGINRNESGYPEVNSFYQNKPYLEAGFGFENIFNLFSISSVHRLTYTEGLQGHHRRNWGINLGLRFQF